MNDEDGTKSEPDGGGGGGDQHHQEKEASKSTSSAISMSSANVIEKVGGVASVAGGSRRVSGPPSTTPSPAKKTPNDFIFGKLLGEGSFSSVYLAKDVKTGKEYAIKVCDKQHIIRERKAESIRREKEVLTILSANRSPTAPFFVHLYATFQDSQRLYFMVTFAHGGELLKFLHKVGSFELTCCRFYSAEILQALRHLHTIGIVHRDLKPENILLNEYGHILITDFGSAKIINSQQQQPATSETTNSESNRTRSNSFVGTAQYVSPEVLKGRYSEVGPSADLWAFGCILYQLISGALPFQATNEFLIFQKILKLEYEFPTGFPPAIKDLVEQLLKIEPSERLGAKDEKLYESIQKHEFFQSVDFETLWQETPPPIAPISGGGGAVSASTLKSQHEIPENYEPGFNPRIIAERVLRGEDSEFHCCDDDDDDESDIVIGGGGGDETERKQRLEEQMRQSPAAHAAVKGNLILKQGLVNKRKGLFARRRLLFLTEGPHLYYCEPSTLNLKGEIPWSKQLRPEAKDFKIFFVHTPNRTYYLEDQGGFALEWCRAINDMHQYVYGNCSVANA
ncbi:3-phosphoinositide-dependent protein kinase 1 [Orchesella cincta]|uniref:3-phosphoinositide-dependent protein kinase 1 n=1 Tax=Orchesella cincta TaxID=48709 RepID=A0A1D2ML36_ORCCI|nr:3-phosphoinositide-dependent protein kinase 1 [Orchesella cincta]